MTQEEKQLLLQDLCARLPYGVKCYIKFDDGKTFKERTLVPVMIQDFKKHSFISFIPYLRPMSSMTEEEYKEYSKLWNLQDEFPTDADIRLKVDVFDWLNAHHFDFRNLIEKGLAIEVTEDNNPYKE